MALRRSAGSLAGRLLRSLDAPAAAALAVSPAAAAAAAAAAAPAARAAGAAPALAVGGMRGFAAGPADVGLPRPPVVPSGMVPDADGFLPTTAALKNPTADIYYDNHSHEQFAPGGDATKRAFTYFVLTGGRFIYASAIRLAVLKFVLSMTASKDVLAMASLEVDLAKVGEGQTVTVKWRGKPVFVRRRTETEIAEARDVPMAALRDPQTDESRVVNPEWLVVVGVCTHLGCVPLPGAGDYNGWFCPCHGSHYDTSGRIRKGPAPTNLEVPEYKFINDDATLLIG